jgi:hypothetical protein
MAWVRSEKLSARILLWLHTRFFQYPMQTGPCNKMIEVTPDKQVLLQSHLDSKGNDNQSPYMEIHRWLVSSKKMQWSISFCDLSTRQTFALFVRTAILSPQGMIVS